MANEIDNNIGDDSVQQNDTPAEQQTQQTESAEQQTPQNLEEEILPLDDEEEPELWGDDDEDDEPPVNPLDIEDEESKFVDDDGTEEEPQTALEEEVKEEPQTQPVEQVSQPQTQQPLTDEEQYVRNNIDPSFIPGTDEFFDAVEEDARKAVEKSLGEEFDEFNPKHISRYNYFLGQCGKSREAEMQRGLKWCRERDAKVAQQQKAQKIQKDFGDFLNSQITTQEQMKKFQDACDNLTVKQTREINAMIENGDYGAVQQIINRIKGGNTGYRQPRYASQNPRPVRQTKNVNNAPRLSDIL